MPVVKPEELKAMEPHLKRLTEAYKEVHPDVAPGEFDTDSFFEVVDTYLDRELFFRLAGPGAPHIHDAFHAHPHIKHLGGQRWAWVKPLPEYPAWVGIPEEAAQLLNRSEAYININADERRVKFWGYREDEFRGTQHASIIACYTIDLEGPSSPTVRLEETGPMSREVSLAFESPAMIQYVREEWLDVCPLYPTIWEHLDE